MKADKDTFKASVSLALEGRGCISIDERLLNDGYVYETHWGASDWIWNQIPIDRLISFRVSTSDSRGYDLRDLEDGEHIPGERKVVFIDLVFEVSELYGSGRLAATVEFRPEVGDELWWIATSLIQGDHLKEECKQRIAENPRFPHQLLTFSELVDRFEKLSVKCSEAFDEAQLESHLEAIEFDDDSLDDYDLDLD